MTTQDPSQLTGLTPEAIEYGRQVRSALLLFPARAMMLTELFLVVVRPPLFLLAPHPPHHFRLHPLPHPVPLDPLFAPTPLLPIIAFTISPSPLLQFFAAAREGDVEKLQAPLEAGLPANLTNEVRLPLLFLLFSS
jgi:hypothetical protein